MKILYVISRLDAAGPVNQLFDLVIGMDRSKYEIMVVTMEQENSQSRWKDFADAGFRIHCLDIKEKLNQGKKIRALNKVIADFAPDVIHSECLPADLVVAGCNARGAKKITTMHCDIYTDYPILKKGLFALPLMPELMLKMHEKCLHQFDLLIGCSYTLKSLYEKKFPHVTAIQNGIATDRFAYVDLEESTRDAKMEIKNRLGLLPELPVAIVVGSLDVRKNTGFIVKALGDLTVDEAEPFQLVFLGIGDKEEEAKQLAYGKNVFFKGKVSNVEEYLRIADIYLSASMSEGLPLSVLEAGCCGLKMVLSDIPQHQEMVEESGMQGVHFFDYSKEEELRRMTRECLKEEANGKEISHYFRKRFSAQRMRQQYMECYDSLME